ncbi:hypothetical protein B0H15DRAFT_801053 [Mycena belliarum]|uniref:Uncharacterized protein n=1 Tax=Mycena belliarum TaxID=1033014 RepID=A0AAD6U486_9AGAR|nr:hypothetical protein B0H15DRAFT_801053 [Mycena belliae]
MRLMYGPPRYKNLLLLLLSVLLYLSNIAIIHISTPSLFSVQAFNSSQKIIIPTKGLPEYTRSTPTTNASTMENHITAYASEVLQDLFPDMTTSGKLGLFNGTLYDVLESGYSGQDVTVAATGFNITCGYLPFPNTTWNETQKLWQFAFPDPFGTVELGVQPAQIIGVYVAPPNITAWNSVTLFSTGIPIFDSNQEVGPWVQLDNPMIAPPGLDTGNVTAIQFLQCSGTLVPQRATVQAQSREAYAVEPDIVKHQSAWRPYAGPAPGLINGTMIEMWARWFQNAGSMGGSTTFEGNTGFVPVTSMSIQIASLQVPAQSAQSSGPKNCATEHHPA